MRTLPSITLLLLAVSVNGAAPPSWAGEVRGGWLELVDTTRLPILREDNCKLVSSYDRFGGNNDGFLGTFSFQRVDDGKFVLFDDDGPGCVYRIWSANPGHNRIEFYFDGETTPRLVFDPWIDMFRNRTEPFVEPVSVFALGGCVSYVPIPYETSLKIVARDRPKFYQITYQEFPVDANVVSFAPSMDTEEYAKFTRVLDSWSSPGVAPWPEAIEEEHKNTTMIPPGVTGEVLALSGSGVVNALDLIGLTKSEISRCSLMVEVDGVTTTVDCPLRYYFQQGARRAPQGSLLAGRRKDGSLYSYWPMPFRESISICLKNNLDSPLRLRATAGYRAETADALANMGYFYSRFAKPSRAQRGGSYRVLDLDGRGHWCGMSLTMRRNGPGLRFLEGDESLWVDGRDSSTYHGTGTEDYFNGGWYFGGTGWQSLWGCTRLNPLRGRCDAFRMHLTDAVPFQQFLRVVIEHGSGNRVAARYGSVAYYYLAPDDD